MNQLQKELAKAICCLSDVPKECEACEKDGGCPGLWEDVIDQINKVQAIYLKYGYGQKDEGATLPEIDPHSRNCKEGCSDPYIAQMDMKNKGWHLDSVQEKGK